MLPIEIIEFDPVKRTIKCKPQEFYGHRRFDHRLVRYPDDFSTSVYESDIDFTNPKLMGTIDPTNEETSANCGTE